MAVFSGERKSTLREPGRMAVPKGESPTPYAPVHEVRGRVVKTSVELGVRKTTNPLDGRRTPGRAKGASTV